MLSQSNNNSLDFLPLSLMHYRLSDDSRACIFPRLVLLSLKDGVQQVSTNCNLTDIEHMQGISQSFK